MNIIQIVREPGSFKFKVHRYDIGIHPDIFYIMPEAQFQHIQVLHAKYSLWWYHAEPGPIKITAKCRQVIVAGIILVLRSMNLVRSKIFDGSLVVEPVERTDR